MAILTITTDGKQPKRNMRKESAEPNKILLDKFAVNEILFGLIQDHFNDIRPCLLEGVEYTAEDLIGAVLWTELTFFAQRQAHLCLKHLATLPATRLTDMANESCNKTTFCIN